MSRISLTLFVRRFTTMFEDNHSKVLGRWNLKDNEEIKSNFANMDCCGDSLCGIPDNYSKTLLFIINPNSGKGNSEQLFYTQVLPYFEKNTDYKIEYCISRYSNHIDYYISQNKNIINQYDSLIILGGDGMFHLTLNSL